jgi:hypothetical protein
MEHDFWRRFAGQSRKRLAQAINFIYPDGVFWDTNPFPAVNDLFPTSEIQDLLRDLPDDEQLDEVETRGIARFQELLKGNPLQT